MGCALTLIHMLLGSVNKDFGANPSNDLSWGSMTLSKILILILYSSFQSQISRKKYSQRDFFVWVITSQKSSLPPHPSLHGWKDLCKLQGQHENDSCFRYFMYRCKRHSGMMLCSILVFYFVIIEATTVTHIFLKKKCNEQINCLFTILSMRRKGEQKCFK